MNTKNTTDTVERRLVIITTKLGAKDEYTMTDTLSGCFSFARHCYPDAKGVQVKRLHPTQ